MAHVPPDQPDLPPRTPLAPASAPRQADPEIPQRPRTLGARLSTPAAQVFISVVLAAASQILLKLGANAHVSASWVDLTQLSSVWVWLGIIATIGSLVYWLSALRRIELNVAYNLSGLLHVLVPLGSWWVLGEMISARQWLGIGLVFLGVMITAQTCAKVESEEHR